MWFSQLQLQLGYSTEAQLCVGKLRLDDLLRVGHDPGGNGQFAPSAVDVDDDLVVINSRTSFLKTEYNKGWA